MLRSLPLARLRIILLPSKARLLPGLKDGRDEIQSKAAIEIFGFLLVGTRGLRVFLEYVREGVDMEVGWKGDLTRSCATAR